MSNIACLSAHVYPLSKYANTSWTVDKRDKIEFFQMISIKCLSSEKIEEFTSINSSWTSIKSYISLYLEPKIIMVKVYEFMNKQSDKNNMICILHFKKHFKRIKKIYIWTRVMFTYKIYYIQMFVFKSYSWLIVNMSKQNIKKTNYSK